MCSIECRLVVVKGLEGSVMEDSVREGLEERTHSDGRVYYVDHITQSTREK